VTLVTLVTMNRGPLRPPGVRDGETLVSGRDLPLQAGRRSSIAGENSLNEPTAESLKNMTNRLAEYVCAAESARVGRENEPTQLSEGRRILRPSHLP
jgi:hypothetical protein